MQPADEQPSPSAAALARLRERPVFVTGATGMVGSWLTRRLVDGGCTVVVLVLDHDPQSELVRSRTIDRVHVVNGNVESYDTVERAIVAHEVGTVFHLAAQAIVTAGRLAPLRTLETNVRGTWNILEAARVHGSLVRRLVVASSDKAYGDHGEVAYDETTPLIGREPYEVSKSCGDLVAQAYASSYGLPVAIARCGNIYGGGDLNWSRIVPGTLSALLRGEQFVIRSDGTLLRDYLFVEDIVDAYLELAASLDDPAVAGQAFNFGEERPRSVREMYDAVATVVGRTDLEPIVLGEAHDELRYQHLCSDRATKILGWTTSWSLDEGLRATADWYTNFFS